MPILNPPLKIRFTSYVGVEFGDLAKQQYTAENVN
jgi:hypothetical protein